ncbi:MAG: Rieske (2Fe-2S) protein [Candidatus Dormibacteraeota bacterium]|nr:Rieske (2Fe-2S) protein [Candidatus Dormibacteraeota bacterium]
MVSQGMSGKALTELVSGLEQSAALDPLGDKASALVQKLTAADSVKNLLSGTWLGHALHPLMTDLPIGFWSSSVTLDLLGGEDSESGADLLMALGNVAAVGAAATGLADWSDSFGAEKRLGIVHGLANTAGLALMTGSWLARKSGARATGKALGLLGLGVAGASAYLGGHLVFARGLAVQHAGLDIEESVKEWTEVAAEADVVAGKPLRATANDVPVMLVREGGQLLALAALCTHAGGPLDEGEIKDGAVTCPWHGSRFQLADGCIQRGPASLPQPMFQARIRDGRVEVRSA